jgi:hypothetical protein
LARLGGEHLASLSPKEVNQLKPEQKVGLVAIAVSWRESSDGVALYDKLVDASTAARK